MTNFEKAD
jgi:hypothetical protein